MTTAELDMNAVARALFSAIEKSPQYMFHALDEGQRSYYRALATVAINALHQEHAMQQLAEETQELKLS